MSDPIFVTNLGYYGWNTTNWYGMTVGWDQLGSFFTPNFTSAAFLPFFRALYKAFDQPFNLELVDKGNLYT